MTCGLGIPTKGPLAVSPFGRTIVVGGYSRIQTKIIDTLTLRTTHTFDWVPTFDREIIPGDAGVLLADARTRQIKWLNEKSTVIDLNKGRYSVGLSLLGLETLAHFDHDSNKAIVAGPDGKATFEYDVAKSWKSTFLSCLSGTRFGIYEHGYTFLNSLFNFLDIDEGRPENLERLRILDLGSGVEKANLGWDPQSRAIKPALFYSGTRVARIRDGFLEVFEIN